MTTYSLRIRRIGTLKDGCAKRRITLHKQWSCVCQFPSQCDCGGEAVHETEYDGTAISAYEYAVKWQNRMEQPNEHPEQSNMRTATN